jgi:hypothetical protein
MSARAAEAGRWKPCDIDGGKLHIANASAGIGTRTFRIRDPKDGNSLRTHEAMRENGQPFDVATRTWTASFDALEAVMRTLRAPLSAGDRYHAVSWGTVMIAPTRIGGAVLMPRRVVDRGAMLISMDDIRAQRSRKDDSWFTQPENVAPFLDSAKAGNTNQGLVRFETHSDFEIAVKSDGSVARDWYDDHRLVDIVTVAGAEVRIYVMDPARPEMVGCYTKASVVLARIRERLPPGSPWIQKFSGYLAYRDDVAVLKDDERDLFSLR